MGYFFVIGYYAFDLLRGVNIRIFRTFVQLLLHQIERIEQDIRKVPPDSFLIYLR